MQAARLGAFSHCRAAPDCAACTYRDGRYQNTVAADVYVITNHGAVLVGPVVVGGDAASAVVNPFAYRGIPQIRQVVGFGSLRQG